MIVRGSSHRTRAWARLTLGETAGDSCPNLASRLEPTGERCRGQGRHDLRTTDCTLCDQLAHGERGFVEAGVAGPYGRIPYGGNLIS